LGVVRLAQLLERDKSQVSRALRALEQVGLVERDAHTREYRLGWKLFVLAASVGTPRLVQAAIPEMRGLVAEFGESMHLCVLQGDQVLTIHTEAPTHHLRATGWIGRMMPSYCSSAGRVLLWDENREALEHRFAHTRFEAHGPQHCVKNVDDLYKLVLASRAQGYASVREEFEAELVGVSAPVRDFRGVLVAALNMSGPKFRLDKRLDAAGQACASAAARLSHQLGWNGKS
jgi:DNA-binding IclR family transcriptional regulator